LLLLLKRDLIVAESEELITPPSGKYCCKSNTEEIITNNAPAEYFPLNPQEKGSYLIKVSNQIFLYAKISLKTIC